MADDFSPMYVGDLSPSFAPTFRRRDGTVQDLSGLTSSSFSMQMRNVNSGTIKTCTGPWTIDDGLGGMAHYDWQPADTNAAGTWLLSVQLSIPGSKPMHADEKLLEILQVP